MCIRTMRSFAHPWIFTHHDPRLHKSECGMNYLLGKSPTISAAFHQLTCCSLSLPPYPRTQSDLPRLFNSFNCYFSSCIGRTDPIITGQWGPLHYLYPNTRSGASCCWILDLCGGSFLHHSSTLAAWTLIAFLLEMLKFSKVLFSKNKILWRKLKSPLEWYSGIFYFATWNF